MKKETKMKEENYFKIIDDGKLETSELLQKCRDKFPVWSSFDDQELDKDFPKPTKATTRYFKKNVEADKENANKSAEDLEKEGHQGITIRERIIMELDYFEETGKHLDIKNWTLCTGSRRRDGCVPCACWRDGFCVDWCYSSLRPSYLRSRSAFNSLSLNLESLDLESAIKLVKKEGYIIYKKI